MKISKAPAIGGVCLLITFSAGFLVRSLVLPKTIDLVSSAQAQEQGSRRCSTRTLKGAYGIRFEGQKVNVGPFVSISRIVFDGEGHFTTNEIGRFNGEPVQRSFTGPYTVNDDCTGFLDFSSGLTIPPHDVHGDFVIVNQGQEFFVIDNEEGWTASGVGKKL